jgi:hypothetical protein
MDRSWARDGAGADRGVRSGAVRRLVQSETQTATVTVVPIVRRGGGPEVDGAQLQLSELQLVTYDRRGCTSIGTGCNSTRGSLGCEQPAGESHLRRRRLTQGRALYPGATSVRPNQRRRLNPNPAGQASTVAAVHPIRIPAPGSGTNAVPTHRSGDTPVQRPLVSASFDITASTSRLPAGLPRSSVKSASDEPRRRRRRGRWHRNRLTAIPRRRRWDRARARRAAGRCGWSS